MQSPMAPPSPEAPDCEGKRLGLTAMAGETLADAFTYKQGGTCEQWIKEGKGAIKTWDRRTLLDERRT
jgi:hypothetical protein